jgi:hypothetical protein
VVRFARFVFQAQRLFGVPPQRRVRAFHLRRAGAARVDDWTWIFTSFVDGLGHRGMGNIGGIYIPICTLKSQKCVSGGTNQVKI